MKCRICGNTTANQPYDVREMMFGQRDVFRYFQCSQCQCLQIGDIPADMSPYYPENYYSYEAAGNDRGRWRRWLTRWRFDYAMWERSIVGTRALSRFPTSRLRFLNPLPVTRHTSILDVGCGAGALLHSLRELGMQNLLGIDPYNRQDIRHENGLVIQRKQLAEVSGTWDIVMFHHSFEHVPDPLATLKCAAGLLRAGGHCVIRIPLASSHAWDHYGVDWVQLDAPRHFFLHSVKSMHMLAEQAGLKPGPVVYDSTGFQLWGSEQYRRDIPHQDERSHARNPGASLFSKSEMAAFNRHAKQLNAARRGDQAIFYFRKA